MRAAVVIGAVALGAWAAAPAAAAPAAAPPAPAPAPPAAPAAAPGDDQAEPDPASPDPAATDQVATDPAATDPAATPEPAEPALAASDEPTFAAPDVRIHGFASEGGFVSTANDYIGASSRGSLALFEVGLNVSTELPDRLRIGVQLFSRTVGDLRDDAPRVDWAYLDYRWRDWLGARAGIIKMPFGLYNEYVDIDAARLPILMPQSVYPLRNRDILLSHTGFSAYGNRSFGAAGNLDYQAWLGVLSLPREAFDVIGATLESADSRYVTGAQLFWQPPIEGLRVGATYLRASIDFHLRLDPDSVEELVMAGLVPADYDGAIRISQRPDTLLVGSAEYLRGDWSLAAEYSRWLKRQVSSLPDLVSAVHEDAERFYVLASYQASARVAAGGYLSVSHVDADDRRGRDQTRFSEPFHAWQRDLAATLRFDVNEYWLWKAEAHLIDGTADLPLATNADPERYWGLFLVRTTVSF